MNLTLMEFLIIHAPLCMTFETAQLLKSTECSDPIILNQITQELQDENIEIFNVDTNVIVAENGFHVIIDPRKLTTLLPAKEHPYLYIELMLKYTDELERYI